MSFKVIGGELQVGWRNDALLLEAALLPTRELGVNVETGSRWGGHVSVMIRFMNMLLHCLSSLDPIRILCRLVSQ